MSIQKNPIVYIEIQHNKEEYNINTVMREEKIALAIIDTALNQLYFNF